MKFVLFFLCEIKERLICGNRTLSLRNLYNSNNSVIIIIIIIIISSSSSSSSSSTSIKADSSGVGWGKFYKPEGYEFDSWWGH
jgi:hypothetical protein